MDEIIQERNDLEARIDKLDDFRRSRQFLELDRDEQILQNRQYSLMQELSDVLTQRIARFKF